MQSLSLLLSDANATSQMAKNLGAMLHPGDVILLAGSVGAGKTHFARSLIQSLLPGYEDVPSPTFTLVQTYDTSAGEIWHADLYRLSSLDEIEELGLIDAFDTAISMIEWPDRLGPLAPASALEITLEPTDDDDARQMQVQWNNAKWTSRMESWTA